MEGMVPASHHWRHSMGGRHGRSGRPLDLVRMVVDSAQVDEVTANQSRDLQPVTQLCASTHTRILPLALYLYESPNLVHTRRIVDCE